MKNGMRLINRGFEGMRTGPYATRLVTGGSRAAAEAIASSTGAEFVAKESPSRNRARAVVVPDSPEAGVVSAREPAAVVAGLAAAGAWVRANA